MLIDGVYPAGRRLLCEGRSAVIATPEPSGETTTPTATSPSEPTLESPFGPMKRYESKRHPFSILYPATWSEEPTDPNGAAVASFAGEQGTLLIVEELVAREYIDLSGPFAVVDYGKALLSSEYGETLLSDTHFEFVFGNLEEGPGGPIYTMEFTSFDATYNVFNFIIGRIAFQAIYVTPIDRSEELEDLVDYLLSSFRLD